MTRAIEVRRRPARRAGGFPPLPRPDELIEVPGDELQPVGRDDPRPCVGEPIQGVELYFSKDVNRVFNPSAKVGCAKMPASRAV
jgi:hypothetical protein